jgi:hypothetical protein
MLVRLCFGQDTVIYQMINWCPLIIYISNLIICVKNVSLYYNDFVILQNYETTNEPEAFKKTSWIQIG